MFSFVCLIIGLFLCRLATSIEWVEYKGLWYYISNGDMVDYTEATAKCDSMNAHLAVITTVEQNNFIKSEAMDGTDLWIGLSNQGTYHNAGSCENNTLFWNSDWNCTNNFNANAYPLTPELSECMGVVTNTGMWRVESCSLEIGYICQWECKRFYLDLKYENGNLSGIYEFESYFNQNLVYTKSGTDNRISIYKIGIGMYVNHWSIIDKDALKYFKAKSSSDLYVPYDRDLAWTTISGGPIISSTFCVECETLHICISPQISEITLECFTLFLNSISPEYINTKQNIFLKNHTNSELCICKPTRDQCGMNCGYIFPYPDVTTNLTIGSYAAVTLTNVCQGPQETTAQVYDVETTITEQYHMSTENSKQKQTSTSDDDSINEASISDMSSRTVTLALDKSEDMNNLTTIVASTVTVATIIIVLVVVVVVIVLRKKSNKNKDAKSHPQSAGITNPRIGNMNSNVYVEQDGPKLVDSLKPAYAESSVDGHAHNKSCTEDYYTYIDSADKDYSDSNDKSIYSKEKPVGGYLASDYGTLMNDHTKQDKPDPKSQTNDPPVYSEVKKTKYSTQGSKHGEKHKDLQIHENGIRLSDTENAADARNSGQCENNMSRNDCEYSNIERTANGDDDLELFENTVYNQT